MKGESKMTREDKLYSMRGTELIAVADKLGVKVACNKTRTALKEAKSAVVERILAAENEWEKPYDQKYEEEKEKQKKSDIEAEKAMNKSKDKFKDKPENKSEDKSKDTPPEKKSPGRGALLEFEGRAQNICAWAKELGISANTLYGRIYKMNWSIEKAFTTPTRKR